jgi:hypothetical protein
MMPGCLLSSSRSLQHSKQKHLSCVQLCAGLTRAALVIARLQQQASNSSLLAVVRWWNTASNLLCHGNHASVCTVPALTAVLFPYVSACSTKRSHEAQPSQPGMFTSTVTIQSPTGPASVTGTEPHTSKKEAEQHVAQLMLQQLEPDMLQAQEQRGVAAAQQVAAGAAAGLQAVFQQQQQGQA